MSNLKMLAEQLPSVIETMLERVQISCVVADQKGIIMSANNTLHERSGYVPAELLGRSINLFIPTEHRAKHDLYMQRYLETGERKIIGVPRHVEFMHKTKGAVPIQLNISEIEYGSSKYFIAIMPFVGIDDEHNIQDISAMIQTMIDMLSELDSHTATALHMRYHSKYIDQLLKQFIAHTKSEAALVGLSRYDEHNKQDYVHVLTIIDSQHLLTDEVDKSVKAESLGLRNLTSLFGYVLTNHETIISNTPHHDQRRGITEQNIDDRLQRFCSIPVMNLNEYFGVVVLINASVPYDSQTLTKSIERELSLLVRTLSRYSHDLESDEMEHDAVTQAIPRSKSIILVEKLLVEQAKHELKTTICLININQFSVVNDIHGYDIGDLVLRELVKRCADYPDVKYVFRMSADEFMIVMPKYIRSAQLQSFYQHLMAPYQVDDHTLILSIRMSYLTAPDNVSYAHEIYPKLRSVSDRMKNSSEQISGVKMSSHETLSHYGYRANIQKVFDENLFTIFMQAIYDQNQRIHGLEVLLRVKEDNRYVSPVDFITHAVSMGFANRLNQVVIEKVFAELSQSEWIVALTRSIRLLVSINLSPSAADLVRHVRELVSYTQSFDQLLDKVQVEFEFTEDQVSIIKLDDFEAIYKDLHSSNYMISLDDFGVGHSSLSRLISMKFDTIKVDMSFVQALTDQDQSKSSAASLVIQWIVDFAKLRESVVIAEGVETVEQFQLLKDLGVNYFQGYLLAKPMPCDEMLSMIEQENKTLKRP